MGEVLRLYFYLKYGSMNHEQLVYFDTTVADAVIKAVQDQWQNAEIETQRKDQIKAKVLELKDFYITLQRRKGSRTNEELEKKIS